MNANLPFCVNIPESLTLFCYHLLPCVKAHAIWISAEQIIIIKIIELINNKWK